MRTSVVLTLTGPDRVGIVEELTKAMLELGGNVDISRAERLGGEFAVLMLVSLAEQDAEKIDSSLAHLTRQGYKVTVTPTDASAAERHAGWPAYRVEVEGADHEGIVHEIARGLSSQGISIDAMDTDTSRAPVTGTTLFSMSATVLVPPDVAATEWMAALDEAARESNVDVRVTPTDS